MTASTDLLQTLTPYHAKYFASELTRRRRLANDERLANALPNAQVRLTQWKLRGEEHLNLRTFGGGPRRTAP